MKELGTTISQMDFEYFGTSQHKITAEKFLQKENTVLLDVRTWEEVETVKMQFQHHCDVLEIPVNEVPARINEIPKDKLVCVFCSGSVRNVIVFTYLLGMGYKNVKILAGGYPDLMVELKPGKLYKQINK